MKRALLRTRRLLQYGTHYFEIGKKVLPEETGKTNKQTNKQREIQKKNKKKNKKTTKIIKQREIRK